MKRKIQISLFIYFVFFLSMTALASSELKIISRQEWGADENITFENNTGNVLETQNNNFSEHLENPSEVAEQDPEIERIVTHDEGGRKYLWPLQYAKEIKFIVIHYTGLAKKYDDPLEEIRAIYRAHALQRKWGDIGYHFLIDREGKIYEGRKGGPKVIGGHAVAMNKVSIGIALMGNFNEEELPGPMLASLIKLLEHQTKLYNLDPAGQTEYKGKVYPNIHGHSDNSSVKSDPGKFFQPKWVPLRKILAELIQEEPQAKPSQYDFSLLERGNLITGPPDRETEFTISIKNKGRVAWKDGTFLENLDEPKLPRILAKLENEKVPRGGIGTFRGTMVETLPSGMFAPRVRLVVNEVARPEKSFTIPFMIEGYPFGEKPLRVALSFPERNAKISSETGFSLLLANSKIFTFQPYRKVTVNSLGKGKYRVRSSGRNFTLNTPPRFQALSHGILSLTNFENRPAWNQNLNDNTYRGILEINHVDGKLTIINELPLDDYLKGIAEISNGDPQEKIKTIMILARSYAKYYRDQARKFPGKPYDLDDNPDHTQKYLGHGLEQRSPNIVAAAGVTKGKIVTYEGKQVITPYFNQSDGRTRSAQEVWGWTHTPYLKSVPDNFCGSTELKGHGVGLSGCGAAQLAKDGKTAEEIIKYYYQGVEIQDQK